MWIHIWNTDLNELCYFLIPLLPVVVSGDVLLGFVEAFLDSVEMALMNDHVHVVIPPEQIIEAVCRLSTVQDLLL
jgi:F420-dependent methylenetetrahydromethanopterin dehydrogenase